MGRRHHWVPPVKEGAQMSAAEQVSSGVGSLGPRWSSQVLVQNLVPRGLPWRGHISFSAKLMPGICGHRRGSDLLCREPKGSASHWELLH